MLLSSTYRPIPWKGPRPQATVLPVPRSPSLFFPLLVVPKSSVPPTLHDQRVLCSEAYIHPDRAHPAHMKHVSSFSNFRVWWPHADCSDGNLNCWQLHTIQSYRAPGVSPVISFPCGSRPTSTSGPLLLLCHVQYFVYLSPGILSMCAYAPWRQEIRETGLCARCTVTYIPIHKLPHLDTRNTSLL